MYEQWLIEKWNTELYDKKLDFVSLSDSDKLTIVVKSLGTNEELYSIEFFGQYSYRIIDEGYRNKLWKLISEKK